MIDVRQHRSPLRLLASSAILLAATFGTTGCFLKKQVKTFNPPPVAAKLPPQPQPVVLPPAPDTQVAAGPGEGIIPGGLVDLPPAPPRPVAPTKPPAAKTPPVVVETTPPPVVVSPKPAVVISAEDRRTLTRELDDRLDRVKRTLAMVEGKALSPELTALANQARSFLNQAEQARTQDLVTAVNLAKRADLFAMDLVERLP